MEIIYLHIMLIHINVIINPNIKNAIKLLLLMLKKRKGSKKKKIVTKVKDTIFLFFNFYSLFFFKENVRSMNHCHNILNNIINFLFYAFFVWPIIFILKKKII